MKRGLALAAVGSVLLLTGCMLQFDDSGGEPLPPSRVGEPHESELGPGWDEEPDTAPEVADGDLSAAELHDLLSLTATAASSTTSCTPDDVDLGLVFNDSAMGHRYGQLWVRNSSDVPCTVEGFAGFGARGEWGSKFLLTAEQVDPMNADAEQKVLTLAPGEHAHADMEWTGELAGAVSEPMSLLVVQLAHDQDAIGHPIVGQYSSHADPAGSAPGVFDAGIDIGMLTTVRMGAFQPGDPGGRMDRD